MSRQPRNFIQTSFFHIITQGINKSYIFDEAQDIKYYIKIMYDLLNEHKINMIAYCIMNNHTHILIESNSLKDLSKYMQRLNIRYSMYYNKKYNRVGYVFRDRYKAEGIYSKKHLYNCINYIYNNPVKACICQKAEDYPYSNYKKFNKDLDNEDLDDEYVFIDVDDDKNNNTECKDFIRKFLVDYHIDTSELKNNKIILSDLIRLLKDKKHISLRNISKELNIGRETVRRLYNSS